MIQNKEKEIELHQLMELFMKIKKKILYQIEINKKRKEKFYYNLKINQINQNLYKIQIMNL